MEVVDPRNYHGFCLRGEGRANFVISAKNEKNGLRLDVHIFLNTFPFRIVWRLSKQKKTGLISTKQRSEILGIYITNFIAPLISDAYLIKPRIIKMHVEDLEQVR